MKYALVGIWLMVTSLTALADTVTTNAGQVEEGIVRIEGGYAIIEQDWGALWLPMHTVKSIVRSRHPLHELAEKLEVAKDDSDRLFDVAQWAESIGLPGNARKLYERILVLKPDHVRARSRVKDESKGLPLPVKQGHVGQERARRIIELAKRAVPGGSNRTELVSLEIPKATCPECTMALHWEALADSMEQMALETDDPCLRPSREELARMFRSFAIKSATGHPNHRP